jgi:simple sugar transport system ATP-binding protein
LGISTVYQEVNLCPNLTVAENILIGREPMKWGGIDWRTMNARARQILHGLDVDLDVTQTLGICSVAIQQMAAIARALEISSAKILILDEPTSSLTAHETEQLFNVMRKLKSEGMAIIFITHFLDQVYEVADRITVLRNGKLVGTYNTAALPRLELIAKMIGRSLTEFDEMIKIKLESSKHIKGEALLQARELGRAGTIEPFDLELHAGEVVGLAGLLGSGRTEIAGLLFGVDKPDTGSLSMEGRAVNDYSPIRSIERGVALCPEDRKAEGILGELSVRENRPGYAGQPGVVQASELSRTICDCWEIYRAAEYRHPLGRSARKEPEWWQPAKGDPGALACHEPPAAHHGRAYAWY